MDVSYDLLKIFKEVAYYESVSKAAQKLCVTQPSVTKSIKKLESALNLNLFVREKKGLVLSDDGKRLYKYILDSINTLDNTLNFSKNINESNIGVLKIGAGESVSKNILKKTIIEYKKLYPGITIELLNSSSEQLYHDMKYGRLDAVFINSTVVVNDSKYKYFKVLDIEDCFFTTREYYKKIKNVINLKSILSDSLIVQNEKYDTRIFLNNICIKNSIQLKPTIEVDRHSLIVEFVLSGLGIGFATKQYINSYFDSGDLVEIPVNFNIEKRHINCVYKNDKNIRLNNFIKLLLDNINN